jgi:GNAT superfamily N-acetyltransferase
MTENPTPDGPAMDQVDATGPTMCAMPIPAGVSLVCLDAASAANRLDEVTDSYRQSWSDQALAGEDLDLKVDAFRVRAEMALSARNYGLVLAQAAGSVVGFIFGYTLRQERQWFAGLDPAPPPGFTDEFGDTRTVVVAEFEVRQQWQGQGLGRALHDAFLASRTEPRATLTTQADNVARAIYDQWGWTHAGTIPGRPGAYYRSYEVYVRPTRLS